MFFQILIKTIVDFTPMLLTVIAVLAVINIFVLVATQGESKFKVPPVKRPLTWDLVHPTRFISLE